jgi:hypothetical protein
MNKYKACKCGYSMLDGRWYWMCTKCGRTENKTDLKARFVRFVLKRFYGA